MNAGAFRVARLVLSADFVDTLLGHPRQARLLVSNIPF